MTSIGVHKTKIREHLQVIRESIAAGIDLRPATIGFHSSACSIDLLEMYLHKAGKILIGSQIKHEWFKRPRPGQKITPLAERYIQFEFCDKKEILELLYSLEERRNKLIYGSPAKGEIEYTLNTFERFKAKLLKMLAEQGEEIEEANP